jgi:CyaY protein
MATSTLDEARYLDLAHATFRRIVDAFEDVDAEDADVESAGDVVTITWRDGTRCIVNTQRPVRQIWMAGGDRAWHFDWDAERCVWLDDKGSGAELLSTLAAIGQSHGLLLVLGARDADGDR